LNQDWIPLVLGACMQLTQPTTWITSTSDELADVLGRVADLLAAIGTAVPCNSQIPSVGPGGAQQACNIAGYLATVVIRQALQRAIDAINANLSVLNYGLLVMQAIPGFGGIFGIALRALNGLYTTISGGTLSDYQNAVDDPTLFGQVACAIYSAISADGQVTDANFPALLTNVSGIAYAHSDVVTAISNYVSDLGAAGLQQVQAPGVLAAYDCSACGGGGAATGPAHPAPIEQSGSVTITILAGNTNGVYLLTFAESFTTTPQLLLSCDNPDLIVSYEGLTTGGVVIILTAAVPVSSNTIADVSWYAVLPGVR
jgi:hypothetical protein